MRHQRGTTSVEFALVGLVFFIVLFGVMEIGRLLGTWNALDEATRRGARIAAVCPIDHSSIANEAVYGNPTGTGIPLLVNLSTSDIAITYLDASGTAIPDPQGDFDAIRYVRVSIVNYNFWLMIPVIGAVLGALNAPTFQTTIPRESLGVPRSGAGAECFGAAT